MFVDVRHTGAYFRGWLLRLNIVKKGYTTILTPVERINLLGNIFQVYQFECQYKQLMPTSGPRIWASERVTPVWIPQKTLRTKNIVIREWANNLYHAKFSRILEELLLGLNLDK